MTALQKYLRRYRAGFFGMGILLFWIAAAIAAPRLTPYSPSYMDGEHQLVRAGSDGHLLGTDKLGRDILTRVLMGSRSILTVAFCAALFSTVIGSVIGFLSGYIGGKTDLFVMRFMDIIVSIPPLVFALVILGVAQASSLGIIILLISLIYSPQTSRVARSSLLVCKSSEYVEAARMRGESNLYIIFVEILPNTLGPITVEATARFAYSVMTVASLGFLGVGIQPPTPDWGMMVVENKEVMSQAPWTVLYPSLAIASLVIGISLFSDFMNKVLNHEE